MSNPKAPTTPVEALLMGICVTMFLAIIFSLVILWLDARIDRLDALNPPPAPEQTTTH